MDAERAEGIVLRTQPVTESSLIVTWFSREWGKLRTMAKGARRPKSPFRGKIDLFYRDELLFLWNQRSDLHLLHEAFLAQPHAGLRTTLPHLISATYICELVDLATAVEDSNPRIFDLLAECLPALEKNADRVLVIWFEVQLLAAGGWARRWRAEAGTGKVLHSLTGLTMEAAGRVRLSDAQALAARQLLDGIWTAEIGRLPRSRALLLHKSGVDKVK